MEPKQVDAWLGEKFALSFGEDGQQRGVYFPTWGADDWSGGGRQPVWKANLRPWELMNVVVADVADDLVILD